MPVAEAARFIIDRGVLAEGGPVLVRLIAQIASRFGVVVTQKLRGASCASDRRDRRCGVTVRRLERRYDKDAARMAYDKLFSRRHTVRYQFVTLLRQVVGSTCQ